MLLYIHSKTKLLEDRVVQCEMKVKLVPFLKLAIYSKILMTTTTSVPAPWSLHTGPWPATASQSELVYPSYAGRRHKDDFLFEENLANGRLYTTGIT